VRRPALEILSDLVICSLTSTAIVTEQNICDLVSSLSSQLVRHVFTQHRKIVRHVFTQHRKMVLVVERVATLAALWLIWTKQRNILNSLGRARSGLEGVD